MGLAKDSFRAEEYTVDFLPRPPAGATPTYREQLYGYTALREFNVESIKVGILAAAIDAALAGGATAVTPTSFALSDEATVQSQATVLAIADARHKAEQIAAATGHRVSGMRSIELERDLRYIGKVRSVSAGETIEVKPNTELNPTPIEVSKSVEVTFILR